jgi:hypothetical protein
MALVIALTALTALGLFDGSFHADSGQESVAIAERSGQKPGRAYAKANNAEIAYTPTNSSWLNRVEAQFTALRYFVLDGTDHASHKEEGGMIRRYIIWRNNHAYDERLRRIIDRASVA